MITAYFVLAASALAAYTDVRCRRIPNLLVLAVLTGGLALRAGGGMQAVLQSTVIFIALLAAGSLLFSLRIMGGGDVKFIAAAGAALGWPHVIPFLLWTMIAGGLLGILFCLLRGKLRATVSNIGFLSLTLLSGARPQASAASAGSIPYALAIVGGSGAALLTIAFDLHLLRMPI